VHVFAQPHDDLSVADCHARVTELARVGIFGELGRDELTHTGLVELQPTASQRGLVDAVRARGRTRVGHHRDLTPHRNRAPEVEPDPAAAALIATYVAADHGIPATDVEVRVLSTGSAPGDQIRVEVRVRMPAIAVPGLSSVASWTYSTVASLRVDDYRSR